jgi:hypothetical protein
VLDVEQEALAREVEPVLEYSFVTCTPVRELRATRQSCLQERPKIGREAELELALDPPDFGIAQAGIERDAMDRRVRCNHTDPVFGPAELTRQGFPIDVRHRRILAAVEPPPSLRPSVETRQIEGGQRGPQRGPIT